MATSRRSRARHSIAETANAIEAASPQRFEELTGFLFHFCVAGGNRIVDDALGVDPQLAEEPNDLERRLGVCLRVAIAVEPGSAPPVRAWSTAMTVGEDCSVVERRQVARPKAMSTAPR